MGYRRERLPVEELRASTSLQIFCCLFLNLKSLRTFCMGTLKALSFLVIIQKRDNAQARRKKESLRWT
eukprot:scaffold93297_cov14-Tisochrysis_lutea.AAC.1